MHEGGDRYYVQTGDHWYASTKTAMWTTLGLRM